MTVSAVPVHANAAAAKPIQLYVNNKKLTGIEPVIKSGVMYVPFRKFLNALGYKVTYDSTTKNIMGIVDGAELIIWAGWDTIEYDESEYYLNDPIVEINHEIYIPIRLIAYFMKYSVNYEQRKQTVYLLRYGYGQEKAILELVTKFYHNPGPSLMASDNLAAGYVREYEQWVSEIPVTNFTVKINLMKFTAADKAMIWVTYIDNTKVLDSRRETIYKVRKESGEWKVSNSGDVFLHMNLPDDIDESVKQIRMARNKEQETVLADLRTYFKAYNEENVERTLQYTSPSFIKNWNANMTTSESWRDNLKTHFELRESRYKLSKERVVFLGEKEAAVHATLEWSDVTMDVAEGEYKFEAIIYMEYANSQWNYDVEINIDGDYDESEAYKELFH
ncbi:copper amine oxidase N-terminal domain-containing protein [Paenibacillus gorillae]|uniref:copper amine oxidase N-terminal domain-containing protein n=1 Tax=Paenibacillus gorillae TaxID=1243662 RepID=UPI00138AB916|nr:copper amine oxidase N-terminal domain-containing protein [Paenibacillus gorillae]